MQKFFLILSVFMFSMSPAFAKSIDDLYRDVIRADNEGYLPIYVKNRQTPTILTDKDIKIKASAPIPAEKITEPSVINFVNHTQQKEERIKQQQKEWENTIIAVQNNKVTPVEHDKILQEIKKNNPQAIEIYAWMTTRGIGVKQDFIKAFKLYQKAAKLGIKDAENNAAQIYRVLTPDQRAKLSQEI